MGTANRGYRPLGKLCRAELAKMEAALNDSDN